MEGGVRGIVIVFSAFMIQLLAFGNYACVGIYTVHLLDEFDNDAVGVSLISAIHFAVLLCSGPFASFLMTKISYRKLSLAGAAMVSIGIFCSPLIPRLPTLYLFFGVFAGLGGCIIYLPSHILSGLYFDKHRSLSTGVATAGTGMGAVVMPLVVGLLIEEYTWKGSMIILAGLDLHLFIFALFMIPPPKSSDHLKSFSMMSLYQIGEFADDASKSKTIPNGNQIRESEKDAIDVPSTYVKIDPSSARNRLSKNGGHCMLMPYEEKNAVSCEHLSKGATPHLNINGSRYSVSVPDDDISRVFRPSYLTWAATQRFSFHGSQMFYSNDTLNSTSLNARHDRPVSKLHDIRKSNVSSRDSCFEIKETDDVLETAIVEPDCHSLSDKKQNLSSQDLDKDTSCCLVSDAKHSHARNGWKQLLKRQVMIFADFRFIFYFISTTIWSLTTTLFLTFAPELIVMKGYSAIDSAFIFTFYGVGQVVGCVIISIVANFFGKRLMLYIIANILTGILICIIPASYSFLELAAVLILQGIAYGGILGLYMIVLIDIVGIEDMEIGLGYLMLASGIGCFSGPPIGGALGKMYGEYKTPFYMSGILQLFAGIIMLLTLKSRCRNGKSNTESGDMES